jgi:LPS O-antigen subunit length determinant protein (WzzB/FepE family)
MNVQKRSDEIDLLELFLKGILTLKASFLAVLVLFLVGIASGLVYFYSSTKFYQNRMIVSSTILTQSYARVMFENANKLIGEGNVASLASQFKVSQAAVEKISSISVEGLSKTPGEEFKESERFVIIVETSGEQALPELQKGLINYLEDNDFVKVRVEQNRRTLQQMLSAVTQEINDLQELKSRISDGLFFQVARGNVMFDPTTVNSKILELSERKLNYGNALELSNSVQIVEGFSEFKKESRPRLTSSLVGGALLGFLLAGTFLAIKGLRRLLKIAASN